MGQRDSAYDLLEGALQRTLRETIEVPVIELAQYAIHGGKRLRGSLCLEAAFAVGAHREQALPFAVGIELIHAASLLLDDLPTMDNALSRRDKPCLHVVYGVAAAELTA